MTRLSIAWTMTLASLVTVYLGFYVVYSLTHSKPLDAGIIGALVLAIGAFVAHGGIAIINRNPPEPTP